MFIHTYLKAPLFARIDPDNMVEITPYHAKLFAHQLAKRASSNTIEKLASALIDAQVDLNPHQVEAALFAFQSPLSKGAILADEVGLGKTIEAGLVISQKWAERKRKILIIVPSSLRKQWSQELQEKFFLPSVIFETKSFNAVIKTGNLNPFDTKDEIIITSYHFARKCCPYIKNIQWDLVVIDEAHRLRNVYKTTSKVARDIREALQPYPKLLLTATPLQNSLLELYGLVSIIDEHVFGDINSFKSQFARLGDATYEFDDLKERLRTICKRTLRRQVLEYIRYTNRIAITQEYTPRSDEQELYEEISAYLQEDQLYALPSSQRELMTLMLRKLLASSSFAIAQTLEKLVLRLKLIVENYENKVKETIEESFDPSAEIETFTEYSDEWVDDNEEDTEEETQKTKKEKVYTSEDIEQINKEIKKLEYLTEKARSVLKNSKGENLVQALRLGFKKTREIGGIEKALIFTESTRTQKYILDILSATEYKDKIVLFNGSNTDEKSKQIYKDWLEKNKDTDKVSGSKTADIRSALVEYFRDEAVVMIATEAAAEGINLQFCSLVVNYDLPWNPQRIEQRIGRCHRYGQKNDVIVVNFLNVKNAADKRVYEILDQKFKLFNGVFGASDEVLGSIESGIDFEKRILHIYQKARTSQEIESAFDDLQKDLEDQITATVESTRKKLLENFDEEVNQKLRIRLQESKDYISKYEDWLWTVTKHYLKDFANFSETELSFMLHKNPFPGENIPPGPYKLGKNIADAHIFRVGHPLAAKIIEGARYLELSDKELIFDYKNSSKKITILEPLVGKSGWLIAKSLTISSLEDEDHVVLAAISDDGEVLDNDQCSRLFSLNAEVGKSIEISGIEVEKLDEIFISQQSIIINGIIQRNSEIFNLEIDKLDKWADDNRHALKNKLNELDIQIKEKKKEARLSGNLQEKLALRKGLQGLERKYDEMWMEYESQAKKIEKNKDSLIDTLEERLKQDIKVEKIFTIRWSIV